MVVQEQEIATEIVHPLDPTLLRLTDEETQFLHAVIAPDDEDLRAKILDVQKRAYEKYPYPCIRAFHFVNLMMIANPIYPTVLAAGRRGGTLFLDLGCCMGTDVRKLAYDGYPGAQIFGCDLRQEYIELGYELFGDVDTCPIRFFTSNVFDLPKTIDPATNNVADPDPSTVTSLIQLRGALTHIYTGALFHLFTEEAQYELAVRLVTLLKRVPGAVIFGRHQGRREAGVINDQYGRDRYGHSEKSWPQLWKRVFAEAEGEEFAKRVVVHAELRDQFKPDVFGTPEAICGERKREHLGMKSRRREAEWTMDVPAAPSTPSPSIRPIRTASRYNDSPEACGLPPLKGFLRFVQWEPLYHALDVLRLRKRQAVLGILGRTTGPASDREPLEQQCN
ncbi:hypothetical protein NUW54_g3621 [Trametes sanguinea]|uniref:Uncharacterized protein n=1 Tax=Trametes sanguinea TaxID=158606 RepID=A0ACC1Q0H2_9APHY|nr:hypothetical protein NUW54_g3621 [Trametes sanguinea]